MGWTSFPICLSDSFVNSKGEFDRKGFLNHEFTSNGKDYTWEVIKSSMHGSTWYGAIKRTKKADNSSIIYAEVILTAIEKGEFYYKEMSEDMGPCYYDCPVSILKLLSPTDYQFAIEWREKCQQKRQQRNLINQFWRNAQDKSKVDYIKYIAQQDFTKEYKKGDEIFLHYRTYMFRGKLTQCWSDGVYRFHKKDIDPRFCTLINKDGTEFKMVFPESII